MSGKPFQSKLAPYQADVFAWLDAGMSFRQVADELQRVHRLTVTRNAVFSFAKSRRWQRGGRLFYEGLSPDLRDQLIKQISAVWTHDSTALEGNTLTLGDTFKVLELGLTIDGKTLREHQEVYGHARAIDLLYRMLSRALVTEQDVFDLHCAVMPPSPIDALNPVGNWKQSYNGTSGIIDGQLTLMEYADPLDVPALMRRWLDDFNQSRNTPLDAEAVIRAYADTHLGFVRIHPFFDGNGRMARLIANLPVLRWGHPP
ncbi:MAG: Fic family protein, partial [Verrucomicrobiota bacterium]|nr:Fic family protein [Verrucomicrobiota bacterium]